MKNDYLIINNIIHIICNHKGKKFVVVVDFEDLGLVKNTTWCLSRGGRNLYARGAVDGKRIYLHRLIMGGTAEVVDHIDGDSLNNTRKNLRCCSNSNNVKNSRIKEGRKYKGPVKRKNGRYTSYIKFNFKSISLGTYDTELEAAQAYNKAALTYFGKFARLNVIEDLNNTK